MIRTTKGRDSPRKERTDNRMRDIPKIMNICQQMKGTCDRIESIAAGLDLISTGDEILSGDYETIMFDELEHLQALVLHLTDRLTENTDLENAKSKGDSVFFAGELNSELGDEEKED